MEIKHQETATEGSFYIELVAKKVGEITYTLSGSDLSIEHTEVGEELKGKGAGSQLLNAVVEYARAKNYKVIPVCSFAKSSFEKKEEIRDVLK